MIVGKIADQLGNQMFTYASLKTIAQDRGEEFCFVRADNELINDTDIKYGNEIHTIFPNIKDEFRSEIPIQVENIYQEPPLTERTTNYQEKALEVPENTLMIGHYISCRYFDHNIENVRSWFAFPEDILDTVMEEMKGLRNQYGNRPLVAVHFRVGEDYTKQGFRLKSSYWIKAAEYILQHSEQRPVFLVFYDRREKKGGIVNRFINTYDCVVCRGSLIHDLCMMSRCDKQIICNSSFSIMSAVLNVNPENEIVRPSVYPVGRYFYPTDCFSDEWIVVESEQSLAARYSFFWMTFKGKILKVIRRNGKKRGE